MNLKQLFAAKDMTQGPAWKRILEFSIPRLLGTAREQIVPARVSHYFKQIEFLIDYVERLYASYNYRFYLISFYK